MLDDLSVGDAPEVGDGHALVTGLEMQAAVGADQVPFGDSTLDVQAQVGELAAQPVDVADERLRTVLCLRIVLGVAFAEMRGGGLLRLVVIECLLLTSSPS